jgi:class 3 adenylate cyclase
VTTSERSLATILFTDIVGSTERATELGDRKWRQLLEEHHARVRRELRRFGGRELNISGDGFLAVFEGPARAIDSVEGSGIGFEDRGPRVLKGVEGERRLYAVTSVPAAGLDRVERRQCPSAAWARARSRRRRSSIA